MQCTAAAPKKQPRRKKQPEITMVSVERLRPSPENDTLYRPFDDADPANAELIRSVGDHGVQEPLKVTADRYVVSGHRRLAAAIAAGVSAVPCIILPWKKDDDHDRFMQLLRECNRQRVKSFDEKLREAVVSSTPEVAYQTLIDYRQTLSCLSLDTLDIRDKKKRCEISAAKLPFLAAIQAIIKELKPFWPISDRRIHYNLLNNPPLKHASKPDSLYRNDTRSTNALTELLARARIVGLIPFDVISDDTRPVTTWKVHRDVSAFVKKEVDTFCGGYWRDLLQSQPNHIEIVGEKNTIESIIQPVAAEYCIPMTIGRGYCSLRPRYDIAERFRKSGKDKLVLLMISDFDPDGEEIAHSMARSLRDDFEIENIEPVKVALTAEQVERFALPPMLKAKGGSRRQRFVDKYGDDVWELEALPPKTLQDVLRDAIDGVLDREAFNHELDREKADAAKLEGVRRIMLDTFRGWEGGEL